MAKRDKDTITLGSGKAYIKEYTEGESINVTTLCTDDNLLAHIKGGAELTYTEETHEEKDDLGLVSKIVTISEEAVLKLGLLTWNGDTLKKLIERCNVTETDGKRTIKIGGADNSAGNKDWIVCFAHEDKKDGNLWVVIRGRNTAGLTLTLAADAGTILEPEFKALPLADGTLITLIEEIDT